MLKNLLLLLLAATGARLMAQTWPNCDLPPSSYLLNGNNVTALIQNNGMLFNSTDTDAGFRVYLPSADAETHTLRRASIWIGGLDPGGNMFLATGGDHGDSSVMRFKPGKINVATQMPYPGSCENFNNIWRVERDAIQRHIFDFLDNGVIDHPEPSLMAWPGRGNPHFEAYNGFPFPSDTPPAMMAPFWDADGDRMYNPLRGDYPSAGHFHLNYIIFDAITWCAYQAYPYEIAQTAYVIRCSNDAPLNNSVIFDFAILNQSYEVMDSAYLGIHTEFEIGCYGDDYVGTALERNAYFAYNAMPPLGEAKCHCDAPALCAHLPVQSVKFIDVNMDHTIAYGTTAEGAYFPHPMSPGFNMYELYHLLNGHWRSGYPVRASGNGFLSMAAPTDHIYTGRPGVAGQWSMLEEALQSGNMQMLGSTKIGTFIPGEVFRFSVAYTSHYSTGLPDPWLGQYDVMLNELPQVDDWFWFPFDICPRVVLSGTNEKDSPAPLLVFPNPAGESLDIQFGEEGGHRKYALYDLSGRLLASGVFQAGARASLDVSKLRPGVYWMEIRETTGVRRHVRWCKI